MRQERRDKSLAGFVAFQPIGALRIVTAHRMRDVVYLVERGNPIVIQMLEELDHEKSDGA